MTEAEKASHTPEPWPDFESVAMKSKVCDMEVVELGRENYNRARDCVNACFDMDDDEIAQIMAESKGIGMRLSQKEYAISELNRLMAETVQQREELQAKCDELLHTLRVIAESKEICRVSAQRLACEAIERHMVKQ